MRPVRKIRLSRYKQDRLIEHFVAGTTGSSHYASDSEVVREAVREKQLRAAEVERIRAALIQAEASGL